MYFFLVIVEFLAGKKNDRKAKEMESMFQDRFN